MQTYSYTFRHKNGWGVCRTGDFPPATHCHECGAEFAKQKADAITSGFGCGAGVRVGDTRDGQHIEQSPAICYACCHKHDVAQLQDRSKPFTAYVSGDGKQITNWPGAALMRITAESSSRGGFGGRMHYWRAVDIHGQHWHGKNSGRGACINLRACK